MSASLEALLCQASHVLVVTHVDPDPDAIGSLLAVGALLEQLGVEHTLLSSGGVPYDADFLPGLDAIVTTAPPSFQVAVLVDCPEPSRIGPASDRLRGVTTVNIDHHPTNTRFGEVVLVDSAALSTTQIVYRLTAELGLDVTPRLATYLLTGLVGDTQCFRVPATDRRALEDAAALMVAGADLAEVNRGVFGSRPRQYLALWGAALAGLALDGDLAWVPISLSARSAAGVPEDEDAGLVNFLLSARGVRAAAVFSERSDGTVAVSLRSLPGVDVAQVAAAFGGGGHHQAAGCTVPGDLESVSARVLPVLRQAMDGPALRCGAH